MGGGCQFSSPFCSLHSPVLVVEFNDCVFLLGISYCVYRLCGEMRKHQETLEPEDVTLQSLVRTQGLCRASTDVNA